MDLSFYLSEILERQGEINVPGLGHFSRVRVNGYYDEDEARFYPPHHQVQFNPKAADNDDALSVYVAGKKDISLSSSQFFTGQYVKSLLQDASVKEAEIGDLGWLRADRLGLVFRPKISNKSNSEFFGLPAVSVHKLGSQPAPVDPIPDLSLTISPEPESPVQITEEPQVPVQVPEPVQQQVAAELPEAQQDTFEDEAYEYEEKRGLNVKLIAMIAAAVLIAATVGLYFYDPSIFGTPEKRKPLVEGYTQSSTSSGQPATAPDTAAKVAAPTNTAPVAADTATQTTAQQNIITTDPNKEISLDVPVETTIVDEQAQATIAENVNELPWHPTFAIIGGTFPTQEKAEDAVDEFKARNITAQILSDDKSKKKLVVIGSYKTRAEANEALRELKRVRKARKDIYIKELK